MSNICHVNVGLLRLHSMLTARGSQELAVIAKFKKPVCVSVSLANTYNKLSRKLKLVESSSKRSGTIQFVYVAPLVWASKVRWYHFPAFYTGFFRLHLNHADVVVRWNFRFFMQVLYPETDEFTLAGQQQFKIIYMSKLPLGARDRRPCY